MMKEPVKEYALNKREPVLKILDPITDHEIDSVRNMRLYYYHTGLC